jgi:hypothetical protein
MTDKFNAIHSLRPTCGFGIKEDGSVDWFETNSQERPTDVEIDAEIVRLQAEYDSKAYIAKRQKEYPPFADLADALYHQSKGDETKLTAYLAKCEAVKTKYPKST